MVAALKRFDVSGCKTLDSVLNRIGATDDYTEAKAPGGFEGYKGIIDPNGRKIAVVSSSYDLLQPREALNFVLPVVEEFGITFTKAAYLQGGCQLVIQGKLADLEVDRSDLRKGDIVALGINFFTSFDGSKRSSFGLQMERCWCDNGCTSWEQLAGFQVKHTKNQRDRIETQLDELDGLDEVVDRLQTTMCELAHLQIDGDTADKIIKRVVNKDSTRATNQREAISREFNNKDRGTYGETGWDLFNAFTAYATHEVTYRQTANTSREENRLSSVLFGDAYSRKVVNTIMAVAA